MLPNDDESQMTNPFNRISDLTNLKIDDDLTSNVQHESYITKLDQFVRDEKLKMEQL